MTIREYVDALTKLASEQVGWETEVVIHQAPFNGFEGERPTQIDAVGPEVSRDATGETVVELM